MARYRMILRGLWEPERPDYAGFYTGRTVRAETLEDAQAKAVEILAHEWKTQPTLAPGQSKLSILCVDGWKLGPMRGWRLPKTGHTFFTDLEAEYDAASIEAQVSKAPRESRIWQIATPAGQLDSEFHLLD
ncbi:hypothetical protein [Qipengyuania sp.]|uniref:hypothetical protein n=1 Tax=Qipengyuania sp. TaxID=2004515 RepID=UPI003AF82197